MPPSDIDSVASIPIYLGGYVPSLYLCTEAGHPNEGWLCYRHPDGQLVTLVDLKSYRYLIPKPKL